MEFKIHRVSQGPKHHLFGFHDLPQTNARGDLALSLEVDDISHPPLPGETCGSGVINLASGRFQEIHRTRTWNYPQGARQQWIGNSDLFTCNDRDDRGRLVSILSDARTGKVIDKFPFPIQCIQAEKQLAFFQNFDRLHAVGGYGYHPLTKMPNQRLVDIPDDDGLWVGDLRTKEIRLIADLKRISACGEPYPINTGYPQYVTHGMLNPGGTRIIFIHRYRVVDGGDIDRYMTCNLDGSDLRCIGKGFLSHFTWIDDETIFAWGQDQRAICAVRESKYLRIPGVLQSALLAKKIIRGIRSLRSSKGNATQVRSSSATVQGKTFLLIKDAPIQSHTQVGVGLLTEDGHPMANPRNMNLIVNDTYPNKDGDRWLMFYDVSRNERTNVCQFRRLFATPDTNAFDWKSAMSGIDPRVVKKFPRDLYLFTRSGYHTDLHPRWSHDGNMAFFDSIHEGSRQIYAVEASAL